MKKVFVLVFIAIALVIATYLYKSRPSWPAEATLNALGEYGKAGLTTVNSLDNQVSVHIELEDSTTGGHPSYVRKGTCAAPAEIVQVLTPVDQGISETTLDVTPSDFTKERPLIISVHLSEDDRLEYISCGNINF